ncbi:unnamed protein product [Caenorhabditis angaria]|uniref:Arginyl-tRNA--protein transferase 1 n=1 Tax=Caenorhabditis angaria TaxID=860376 RepID=A0A9P1I6H1_9PELO|nr:unnamed protein product [Caenorhabditis angaria]
MQRTILEYCGESGGNSCGYCKHKDKTGGNNSKEEEHEDEDKGTSHSLGLMAYSLSSSYYLELMDMGWRRSGKYLYKPTNEITCCPQYTIRLDVTKFTLSRSQKRTLRQMNEYLISGKKPRCSVKDEDNKMEEGPKKQETEKKEIEKKEKEDRPVIKKKEMRRKRFEEKCRLKNLNIEEMKKERVEKEESRRRTIESFIIESSESHSHKLEVKLVSTSSEEFQTKNDESYELYKKYQQTIHKDERASFAGYRRFLCDSPISEETDSTGRLKLGSYHLWFLLDNKLIAVSVIDILPRCLSAKYMFYDPDFSFLSLGTYTALRELEFTRKYFAINPEIRYYYMGYYIDSCPKMRYKAKFRPSDLLCDNSFQWIGYESCKELFADSKETNGYTVFRPDLEPPQPLPIEDLIVLSNRKLMSYSIYKRRFSNGNEDLESVERHLQDLAKKVGPKIPEAIYYFNELN